jgi:hypothetical protein
LAISPPESWANERLASHGSSSKIGILAGMGAEFSVSRLFPLA